MNKTIKTAVSLPAETYRHGEALRKKTGKSRSALYAIAIDSYFKAMEVREKELRYEAGYRKHPETVEEKAAIEAFNKLSAESLEKEDW